MTLVDNVDGDYLACSPYDHCRHGVYVGGCGYDYMCPACEMGDPDLTVRQAAAHVDALAREVWADWDRVMGSVYAQGCSGEAFAELVEMFEDLPVCRRLASAVRDRDRIARIATGPDDDQYLVRAHRADKDRWDRQLIAVALDEGYARVRGGFEATAATPNEPGYLDRMTFADVERLDDRLNHRR